MNRFGFFTCLILCCSLLFACQTKRTTNEVKKFKANNFNFSNFKRYHHDGLYFYLPKLLSKSYSTSYLSNADGLSFANNELSIYFSVEFFDEQEAENFQFTFDDSLSLTEAVHANYVGKRIESLSRANASIIHTYPKKGPVTGQYQFVSGSSNFYSDEAMYFISTVHKSNKSDQFYYVLQLVCSKEMAPYLEDDFKKILQKLH